jgi:peroxiredoxin
MVQTTELSIGSPVPDFRLPSNLGGEVGPADFKGKSILVLFFVREFN